MQNIEAKLAKKAAQRAEKFASWFVKEKDKEKCVTKSQHTVVYAAFFLFLVTRVELMSQVVKRKSTPETKAGQYMCPECGQIFDDKKSVDIHIHMMHEPRL